MPINLSTSKTIEIQKVSWNSKWHRLMHELKEKIRNVAGLYASNLRDKIEDRKKLMEADDNSHYLIYRALGMTTKEGKLIDLYQNAGRFY